MLCQECYRFEEELCFGDDLNCEDRNVLPMCLQCKYWPKQCYELCNEALDEEYQHETDGFEMFFCDPDVLDYVADSSLMSDSGSRWPESPANYDLGTKEWELIEQCGLTERQKECLHLFFWKKKTDKQIAKKLGIYRSTVHTHIKRAKEKLVGIFPL